MKKLIQKAKDGFEDLLRRMCGRINPDRRVIVIVALFVVFAMVNIWVTFRAIFNIGREDSRIERIELPVEIDPGPAVDAGNEPPSELQLEIEDFFNTHFNNETDDTTASQ